MNNNSNNYDRYGQYRTFQNARYREEKPPRRNAPAALLILLALVAGFVGGGLSGLLFRKEPVTEQVMAILRGDEETAPPDGVTEPTEQPEREERESPEPYPPAASIAEEVAAAVSASVVEVNTESKVTHPFFGSYITDGAGSGVILSSDGYIVTNHHVVEGAGTVTVRLSDGTVYSASLIGDDRQTDLAVLKIDAAGLTPAAFADSDEVAVGQPVVAIGNPLGSLGGTVTEGIISAKDREIVIGEDEMTLLQTSAAINPGNSGGGLFDAEGLLVGVVNAKSAGEDIEGLGFAIPSRTAEFVVRELMENGYVTGRPSLGIELVEVATREALFYYGVNDYGLYVSGVSGADHPLQNGDRLVRIGDAEITGLTDVRRAISESAPGESVPVAVVRGGRLVEADVVLQEMAEG